MIVAVEGVDGTGKRTQAGLMKERAERDGWRAALFSFPRYGKNPFADVVTRYLNGEFGDIGQVPPEFPALAFAGDRYATRALLLEACDENDLVICDRYVASNLAHQAGRLPQANRRRFVAWLRSVEYGVYGLPDPDLTILLDLPVDVALTLVRRKAPRGYTTLKADIHEQDPEYLAACRETYLSLAQETGTRRWETISCLGADGRVCDPDDLAGEVWSFVRPRLTEHGRRIATQDVG